MKNGISEKKTKTLNFEENKMKKRDFDMEAWQEREAQKERKREKRRARRLAFLAKWDPIRFRYGRIFRYLIFYSLFIMTVKASAAPGTGDDINYFAASALAMLIAYIFLDGIFVLYDPTARRRFCKNPPKETGMFSEWKFALCSYEFLSKTVMMTIFPAFLWTKYFIYPIATFFRRTDFSQWEIYGLYLLTVLPIFAVIDLFMRVRTRRFWRTLDEDEAMGKRLDGLAVVMLCVLIIFGLGFISSFYFITISTLITVLLMPEVGLTVFAVILLIFLFHYIRAFRLRFRFLRKLKKVCKEEGVALSKISHPYRSIFFKKSNTYEFTVTMNGKVYACKIISAVFKSVPMIFCDKDSGYFKFGFQVRKNDLFTFRSWFTHGFEAPEADQKILIVNPAPHVMKAIQLHTVFSSENTAFVTEGKFERPLDNASAIYGATVLSGSGFINAVKRNCLDKKDEA